MPYKRKRIGGLSRKAALISKRPEGGREDVLPWVARLETRVGGERNDGGGLFS